MMTLFSFLGLALYWLGACLVCVGTVVLPLLCTVRWKALVCVLASFFGGGIVGMGVAVVDLSYKPPAFTDSPLTPLIAGLALIVGTGVSFTKQPSPKLMPERLEEWKETDAATENSPE